MDWTVIYISGLQECRYTQNRSTVRLAEEVVGPLNPAQKEVVGLLSKGTQRLNSLFHHLLDYNSLLQQSTPQYQVLDLPQIIP